MTLFLNKDPVVIFSKNTTNAYLTETSNDDSLVLTSVEKHLRTVNNKSNLSSELLAIG